MAKLADAPDLRSDAVRREGSNPSTPTILRIYGPYIRKDGRKHLVLFKSDGTTTSMSYPRYLMEQHLGRKLESWEDVDHINNDFTDDRIENLQVLSHKDNAVKEMQREHRKAKMYKFNCPICGKEAEKPLHQVIHNWDKGADGPYCSRSCAGKASHK